MDGRAVVFADTFCPTPYATASLASGAIGGTEATVLRVARALAERGIRVRILQHNRDRMEGGDGLVFEPLDLDRLARDPDVGTLVVINAWKIARRLRRAGLTARLGIWLHNYPGRHNAGMGAALRETGATLICVSRAQTKRVETFLRSRGAPVPRTEIMYNPVSDDLRPDGTTRDPDLMVFASSPHKGLDQVLDAFWRVRERIGGLRLAVADPGYLGIGRDPGLAGVEWHGPLPQARLHALLRRSLCLFYPQRRFAETFGLVIAEANAVGTPALLDRAAGANAEVASSHEQLVDGSDIDAMVARLAAWRERFPDIAVRPEFRTEAVTDAWQGFLRADTAAEIRADEAALA